MSTRFRMLGDNCPRPEAYYYKALPDGREVGVYRMMFGWRVFYGEQGTWGGVIKAFCYREITQAIAAAVAWDGEGDPPDGWHKDVMTGRRREGGDPAREKQEGEP